MQEKVFKDKRYSSIYESIEKLRKTLLADQRKILVKDFGTGNSGARKISSIVAKASKNSHFAQLLFRLVKHFKPQTIVDIGTSLGITTAYLASAAPQANVITLEGCPETLKLAQSNFESLKLSNITTVVGKFEETLISTVRNLEKVDFVFFDGHHEYGPTMRYFKCCKERKHNNSIFVVDDINWSSEMRKTWERIKLDPEVTVTIDLFYMGIVFFRKEQAKENFILKY